MTTPPPTAASGLRIGFVPGVTLTKWRTIWRERFPRVPLEVFEAAEADQRRILTDEAVDLSFVRLPVDADGLHLIRLYDEVPVAWIAKDHPLADLESVTLADLADEEVFDEVDPHTIDLVVLAGAVLRVPMSIARTHSRRDLVYRPVTDAPSTTVGLAWLVDNPNEWIDEFIGVVRGRTVNSSRTTKERTTAQPAPKARKAPPPKASRVSAAAGAEHGLGRRVIVPIMSPRPRPDPVGPGQQSVWDFPRPPALVACTLPVEVVLGGQVICHTSATWQVLETSHPPTFYLPRSDFVAGALSPATGSSWCEWKGQARYLDVHGGDRTAAGKAWYYPSPTTGFAALVDHVALYPAAMDACFVDGERVFPQPGGFYGGWITPWVTGPFKGVPGSTGW